MRRFIILFLTIVPLGAAAQSRAIEALAEKYADRNGFTTTVVKGDLSRGFVGSLDIESVDISNILKDISSIIVVRASRPDDNFTRDVNEAVARGYSTVVSSTDGEDRVRFLLSENPVAAAVAGAGEGSNRKEFVIAITGVTTNIVVSIVGDYTLGKVTIHE